LSMLALPTSCLRASMRAIKYTKRFKLDYKREKSGRHGKTLDDALMGVVNLLAVDTPLPYRNVDHPLSGECVRLFC